MTTFEENIQTANILAQNKSYLKAKDYYQKALSKTTDLAQKIDVYNAIGRLNLLLNDTDNAIDSFEESLSIHNTFQNENSIALKTNKATILNNLGVLYVKNNTKKAIQYHKEALAIFTESNAEKENNYLNHQANTHYSLADAYYTISDFFQAKKHFKEAINLYNSLPNKKAIQPLVANAYYNLGNIYTDENNVFDARNNYLKALKEFRSLSEEQPQSYKSLVAATFNNLAVTAKSMYKYSDAIIYYENALKEYEELIQFDRNTFLPFYAATLNSIGIIYTEQHEVKDDFDSYGLNSFSGFGMLSVDNLKNEKKEQLEKFRKQKAVEYYRKALKVYDELSEKEPNTYTHYVATCLHNLGVLYDGKKEFKLAEEHYEKALNIRRNLAGKHPESFNLDTCVTLLNITTMYQYLLEQTGEIGFKNESLKILKEIEDRLSVYGNSERPVILSMKSDTQYFTQYFNEVDQEYLDVLKKLKIVDAITEKIKETIIPSKKLTLQKDIINILYLLYQKYPDNMRLKEEMLDAYTKYSWFALRSNEITIAEKAIENGFKIAPNSPVLKANQAHLLLIQNKEQEAFEIYDEIKELFDGENESIKKVIETDLKVLKNDGVLKK